MLMKATASVLMACSSYSINDVHRSSDFETFSRTFDSFSINGHSD